MHCEKTYAKETDWVYCAEFFLKTFDVEEPRIIAKEFANIFNYIYMNKVDLGYSEHAIIVAINQH